MGSDCLCGKAQRSNPELVAASLTRCKETLFPCVRLMVVGCSRNLRADFYSGLVFRQNGDDMVAELMCRWKIRPALRPVENRQML